MQQRRPQVGGRRIGQTTIGKNRDVRMDLRADGFVELLEVVFAQTDIVTKPQVTSKLVLSMEGLGRLAAMLDDVLEEAEKPEGTRKPVDDSDYMTRGDA